MPVLTVLLGLQQLLKRFSHDILSCWHLCYFIRVRVNKHQSAPFKIISKSQKSWITKAIELDFFRNSRNQTVWGGLEKIKDFLTTGQEHVSKIVRFRLFATFVSSFSCRYVHYRFTWRQFEVVSKKRFPPPYFLVAPITTRKFFFFFSSL
jgi:hypothetical protein